MPTADIPNFINLETGKEFIEVIRIIIVDLWFIWAILIGIALLKIAFKLLGRWIKKKRQEKWLREHQNLIEWRKVSGRKFEQITAAIFREIGYKTKMVGGRGDKGLDVILNKKRNKYLVQCKNMEKVGPQYIRAFWGSIEEQVKNGEVEKGLFVTTGEFTESGKKFVKEKPIELINGIELEKKYKGLINS